MLKFKIAILVKQNKYYAPINLNDFKQIIQNKLNIKFSYYELQHNIIL